MTSKYDKTPKEQVLYANMLFYGCWSGLALMIVTYLIYIFGVFEPHVSMDVVTRAWVHPVQEYLTVGQVPVGWGWATLLNKGDFLNFLGIALLATLTLVSYVPLIIAYFKKKDTLFALISLAEVLVLAFAASGIVGGGAH